MTGDIQSRDLAGVYPIGSAVTLKGSAITPGSAGVAGIITAVCLRATGATYEVVWWAGVDRKEAWVTADEVSCATPAQRIGFRE